MKNYQCLVYEEIARALIANPEAATDISLQSTICRQYGMPLESLTDDEISHIEQLINELQ